MFDELARLRTDEALRQLLCHYTATANGDRETWQDRLMSLDGVSREELVRLHGELLAFAWIEQNTGVLTEVRAGAVPQCYRVTAAGVRALKRAADPDEKDEYEARAA